MKTTLSFILAIFFSCGFAMAGDEPDGMAELKKVIVSLSELRGDTYKDARDKLLARPGLLEQLKSAKDLSETIQIQIIHQALIYRLENPELIKLADKYWPRTGFVSTDVQKRISMALCIYDNFYSGMMLTCFGRQVFPVLAENLLFCRDEPREVLDTIDALLTTRNLKGLDCLIFLTKNDKASEQFRAAALFGIEQIMRGLPERTIDLRGLKFMGDIPNELDPLYKITTIPAMQTPEDRIDEVYQLFVEALLKSPNEQTRAVAARALRHFALKPKDVLLVTLQRDQSTWVRAWCMDSFMHINTNKALAKRYFDNHMRHGESAEVELAIIDDKKIFNPEAGIPFRSILSEYQPGYRKRRNRAGQSDQTTVKKSEKASLDSKTETSSDGDKAMREEKAEKE